jgi:hypothetical protein
VGQQQASLLADDPSLIAVVGSVDSSVDEGVQPILAEVGIPQLSLGGSVPLLVEPRNGRRPFPTYATYAARSSDRARVATTFVERGDRVAILVGPRRDDRAMAAVFRRGAESAGGRVVLARTVEQAPTEAGQAVARAGLRSALDAVAADVVFAPVEPPLTWEVTVDVRTVEPGATLVLDEAALGRWSDDLDEEREQAEGRGVRWGPTRVVGTGFPAAPVDGASRRATTDAADEPAPGRFALQAQDATELVLDALLAGDVDSDEGSVPIRERIVAAYPEARRGTLGVYRILDPGIASRRLVGVYARGVDRWSPVRGYVASGRCLATGGCSIEPRGR